MGVRRRGEASVSPFWLAARLLTLGDRKPRKARAA